MWTVEFAAAAEHDFELIFAHLFNSYREFGDRPEEAFDRAERRVSETHDRCLDLAKAPFQGTLRPDIMLGLRFVRRDKAVFWFIPDETRRVVQVLAIFFGGQDHIRHMLTRLLSRE